MRLLQVFIFLIILSNISHSKDQQKIITTSINPIYLITKSIVKDLAEVKLIIPANVSPHDFRFKSEDLKKIIESDLFLYVNHQLEANLEKLIDRNNLQERSIQLTKSGGIKLLMQKSGKIDPHIWLNPDNAVKIGEIIAEKLSELDVDNAKIYRKNYRQFRLEIIRSAKEAQKKADKIPDGSLIFYHDGYDYLANYFDFKPALNLRISDHQELKISEVRSIDKLAKSGSLKCIITDVNDYKSSAQKLARNNNLAFVYLDLMASKKNSYVQIYYDLISDIYLCSRKGKDTHFIKDGT